MKPLILTHNKSTVGNRYHTELYSIKVIFCSNSFLNSIIRWFRRYIRTEEKKWINVLLRTRQNLLFGDRLTGPDNHGIDLSISKVNLRISPFIWFSYPFFQSAHFFSTAMIIKNYNNIASTISISMAYWLWMYKTQICI